MAKSKDSLLPNDTARNMAVNSLLLFERDATYIGASLDKIFGASSVELRDRRFATELACGTCRRLITLDWLIDRYSSRPTNRIDPVVMQILRIGLYQLLFLSGTPDFASVDQAVEQAKLFSGYYDDRAGRFVNAVLRAIQRVIVDVRPASGDIAVRKAVPLDGGNFLLFSENVLPAPKANLAKHLAIAFGQPAWLLDRWLKCFGPESTRSLCFACNSRPKLTLRPNRLRCSGPELSDRLTAAGIEHISQGQAIQLAKSLSPDQLCGYDEGWFAVQDATAMSVSPLLSPTGGERILDLCSAPGGKTTHLAELMDNTGDIVACDLTGDKLSLVEANCKRLGISIVETVLSDDLAGLVERDGPFDAVLVDAPCSNTGVLAKRIEVRHLLNPAALRRMAKCQMELLARAASFLKPSGRLLYSTCSIEQVENELLIENFLAGRDDFRLIEQRTILPGGDGVFYHDGG